MVTSSPSVISSAPAPSAAAAASGFDLSPYRPAYPLPLAPALRRALGDSLTPGTLGLYDRLKTLATRVVEQGNARQQVGDPAGAEQLYTAAYALGQRLTGSAMAASDRYLLHLPELTAAIAIQGTALSALRTLYDKYAMTDRLQAIRQSELALDGLRQTAHRGAEAATTTGVKD